MPRLDFKEISQANLSNGEQDSFELFARDFLESIGYKALSGPDRGSDGGKDIIVLETRIGVGGASHIPWLVSCKHKAHSGDSVGVTDEQDIADRVKTHDCIGFIGFYSTLPSSTLTRKLEGLKASNTTFEFQIFDKERIEGILLSSGIGQDIAKRYLPLSFQAWRKENFDIALAMARIGLPQPIAYKFPNDDKVLTVEEVIAMYPQGNQYFFDALMPPGLIFCNNILGITKLIRGKDLIDPTNEYVVQREIRIEQELEILRQERLQTLKSQQNARPPKKKESKRRMTQASKKRNRKK